MKFAHLLDHPAECVCRDCRAALSALARIADGGVVHRGCSAESHFEDASSEEIPPPKTLVAALGERRERMRRVGSRAPAPLVAVAPPTDLSPEPELRDAEDEEIPAVPHDAMATALATRPRR